MKKSNKEELELLAAQIRLETFQEIAALGFGHVGGSMSIADVLAVLYGEAMRYDPKNPKWEGRDWMILSKGHAGPALYATLAIKGFFPKERLQTLNKPGTTLPSHCSRVHTPGIDMTTGSLGQGISSANGVALASRMMGADNNVYLIVGDGELDEGQIWEGALFAGHRKLNNLITFVDANGQQLDGSTDEVCDLGDIGKKFSEFGWYAQNVNGHDVLEISEAIRNAKRNIDKPSVIILHTIKGKGCTLAEGVAANHHIALTNKEEIQTEIDRLQLIVTELEEKVQRGE